MMENYFHDLCQQLFAQLQGNEVLLLNYSGEESDFTRLNHAQIRQAGHVKQQALSLTLIDKQRQTHASMDLCGEQQLDQQQALAILQTMREQLRVLPEDPYINYATEIHNSRDVTDNRLPVAQDAVTEVITAAQGLDLVGIWASGAMHHGFANSLGQFNWHTDYNFNFDWSVYSQGDKAIKQAYAGREWNSEFLQQKLNFAHETLPLLQLKPKTIEPGKYRAFLSPVALQEIISMMNWGGFGLKSHRTQQTPLIKMIKEGLRLNSQVSISENHAAGIVPGFTSAGYILLDEVRLIEKGLYKECLADPRSAREYDAQVNCEYEGARSLQMQGGELHQDQVLKQLDTGVYLSNLWYCNYSDRNNARITGMSRFACLWVENGVPVAPLGVMRFDESIYYMLGDNLIALTEEREHILDDSSYHQRSNASAVLPGALVKDFTFTL